MLMDENAKMEGNERMRENVSLPRKRFKLANFSLFSFLQLSLI